MGKKDTPETFNALLDSLPPVDRDEDELASFTRLIKAFPQRALSGPERRGCLKLEWTATWPFYDVTFNGWEGAAGRREIALVEALQRYTEDGVEAGFIEFGGHAQMRILIDYGDMPLAKFQQVLNLIRPYRVESGYTWVKYANLKEAPRG